MAEHENLQLQGLKTIREMQESIAEQEALREQVRATQSILDGSADAPQPPKQAAPIPNLANAKTIKESMADWVDEGQQTPQNKPTPPQTTAQPQAAPKPSAPTPDTTKAGANMQPSKVVPNPKNIGMPQTTQAPAAKAETKTESEVNSESDEVVLKQEKYKQIMQANANTKQETWLLLDEFLKLSGLEREKVAELIKDKTIKSKQENGRIYVEASTGTSALIKKVESRLVSLDMSGNALDPVFVEKTIATILGLHEKVLSSKDETIAAFKSENSFLKEALVSMQEIYDDDKKTIEILRQQLQKTQEEVDFVKRKYKLMWGKVSNSTT